MSFSDGLGFQYIAAAADSVTLGAGKYDDYLDHILVIPTSKSPGPIVIADGNGTARTVFAGGTDSLADLKPFSIPIGARTVNKTTPGWKIDSGADAALMCFGRF